ncbi:AAA family ATPase [Amycolatopsis sp. FDAARGOS 1241]|uniref:ATP-binding protein n=1 Tax=Amycolatopsis sp. FDAARGOS 1241 TaxID=2778070 RepID=UPI001951DBB1|nr:LuxR family transcriptional regulator [Amycolatopsis sp. FDAARGOS 1241]QRP43357.1 AAA family ATPase [Amycolatopsis sp. FDAARGOS 1241]
MTADARDLPAVGTPRLIGRDHELSRLTAALADPGVVLVSGEAGIGKSRLVRELLPAPGVLVARCPPLREALTLGPIVDALRQARPGVTGLDLSPLVGTLRPLFPEWDLPPAPEGLADAGAARHRLLRALGELLDRFEVGVLVVEDVHWADETTLEFLLFLAARQDRCPGLVLTYRPDEVGDDSLLLRLSSRYPRITLGALDVAQTADLVSSMLGDERVSEPFARFLHRHTDGIPFALEESVRLLRDRADLIRQGGEWIRRSLDEIAVPPTIRDAVAERLVRLTPDAQAALKACAVLSTPATEDDVTEVGGLPAERAGRAIDEAARSGLLADDDRGRLAFRHLLAAKAVYDGIGGRERRELHRRSGRALAARDPAPVAVLAHHFREAGETAKWCEYAERAADLALASGDHHTAVSFLHGLLAEPELPPTAVARLARKTPLFAFTGYLGRVDLVRTVRGVLDSAVLDRRERAEIRSQLGRLLMHAGDYATGAAELARAIPDLVDNPVAVAQAMSVLGRPAGTAWSAPEHREWLDRAETVIRSAVPEDERLSFIVDRATALLEMGDEAGWAVAATVPDDDPRDPLQITRGLLNFGDAALHWGRYGEARAKLTRGVELAQRHGLQRLRDMVLATLIRLDWLTGAWRGLAERVAGFADLAEEPLIQLDTTLVGALLEAATAPGPDVERKLKLVLDETRRRGIADMPLEPAAALARLHLAAGRVAEALEVTEEPMAVVAHKQIWLWAQELAPVRVEALLAAGRGAEAQQLAAEFAASRSGATVAAAALVCRALVTQTSGDQTQAAQAWAAAAAAWAELPRPYDALLAREREAACLLAGADTRTEGLDRLEEVLAGYESLGATAAAERARAAQREHGATSSVWRGGRRGYGDQLSPRELEVVRLLLTGLTNPEIAQVLSRSPKTVAAQLNSAMRKHHVTSRTALAVSATQAGIKPADRAAPVD